MTGEVTAGAGEAVVGRRVRLRPNRNCIGLAALVAAMWYAGASQTNGAAYLLCFLIVGVVAVSAVHAWANLCGLRVACGPIPPVFAGGELRVPVTLHASAARGHAGLRVRIPGGATTALADVRPDRPGHADLTGPAPTRGRFDEVPVEISSLYPIGFFSASVRVRLPRPHFVYPRPDGRRPLPPSPAGGRASRHGFQAEGDDFAGVRAYRRGESQRHIDWKAVARGQPMLVKQWAGEAREQLHLDWNDLAGVAPEARLSQLARWLLAAQRLGIRYSLSLPGVALRAGSGEAHLHQGLRALATAPA
jgi:uncharacterized protein (DUF58 family)